MSGLRASLRYSASSPGTLSCSPRAASKLALKNKTGSDIDAAYPRLRREFQRLGVNLRFRESLSPDTASV